MADPDELSTIVESAISQLEVIAHRLLRRYPTVSRWEQTDDVVQNAAIRLHRALQAIDAADVRCYAALAATQVRRELVDLARHHGSPASDASRHETSGWRRDGGQAVDEAVAPVESSVEMDSWERFREAVKDLPQAERELFDLVWHLGLSQAQVADVLGCSVRTVKRLWCSVKTQLRTAVGDHPPE